MANTNNNFELPEVPQTIPGTGENITWKNYDTKYIPPPRMPKYQGPRPRKAVIAGMIIGTIGTFTNIWKRDYARWYQNKLTYFGRKPLNNNAMKRAINIVITNNLKSGSEYYQMTRGGHRCTKRQRTRKTKRTRRNKTRKVSRKVRLGGRRKTKRRQRINKKTRRNSRKINRK